MTEKFEVRPEDLVTHAGHVEAVAARVTTAAEAGTAVRPGPDTYGKLCVMVPLMLGALQEAVAEGIEEAAKSLHDTGAQLRATAAAYRATDEGQGKTLQGIRDGM